MYRPNRVGPYAVEDTDRTATKPAWPTDWNANFDAEDTIFPDISPHFRTSTVTDEGDTVTWNAEGNVPTLLAARCMAWGVAVSGVQLNERPMLYAVNGAFFSGITQNHRTIGGFFIGRLGDSAVDVTRNAANNSMHSFRWLKPLNQAGWNLVGDINTCFVREDNAADGFHPDPVVFGVAIYNAHDSTAQGFAGLNLSLEVRRYTQDIDLFEPGR
jgi:hypothetical protein